MPIPVAQNQHPFKTLTVHSFSIGKFRTAPSQPATNRDKNATVEVNMKIQRELDCKPESFAGP
jgi:hypothetical protein